MSNRPAFLTMVGCSEGTVTSGATINDGYDVIVTGVGGVPEVFTDYSNHPFANGRAPKVINKNGLLSTASGRYQILLHEWFAYKMLLKLSDFSPASQDAVALQIIKERHALPNIDVGLLDTAIGQCSNIWASFPGNDYAQRQNKIALLEKFFTDAGGVLAAQGNSNDTAIS